MSLTTTTTPRACCLAVALLLVAACSQEKDAPPAAAPPTTPEAATAALPDDAASPPTARDPQRPWVGTPAVAHLRVAAISSIVGKTREQLAPEMFAPMVTTDAVRSSLSGALENEAVAAAVNLDKPMACVLPGGDDTAAGDGVCALTVEGGAKALAPAFTAPYQAAEAGSHLAHFVRPPNPDPDEDETDPVHAYLDEHRGHVVLSFADAGFEQLGDVAVSVAQRPGHDFEFVIYPDQIEAMLGPEVRAEIQAAADGTQAPSDLRKHLSEGVGSALGRIPGLNADDTASVDDSLSALDDASAEDAMKAMAFIEALLDVGAEIREMGVGIDLDPSGLVLSSWYRAAPESSLQRALAKEPRLSSKQFHGLPTSSAFVRGTVPIAYSPFAAIDPVLLDELGLDAGIMNKGLALILEVLVEDSADPTLAAELETFVADQAALYTGTSTWAAFGDQAGGPLGLTLRWPLVEGASAQEPWRAAAKRFGPKRVMGNEAAKSFTWSLRPGADTLDGTKEGAPIDRWTVHSRPSTEDVDDDLAFSLVEPIADALEFSLDIDTVEHDGTFSALVTRTGERAPGVLQAVGDSPPPGLATALERSDHVLSLWAFDVRALRLLLLAHHVPEDPEDRAMLENNIGTDFSDLYGITYLTTDGGVAEIVVSQSLLDQLRKL